MGKLIDLTGQRFGQLTVLCRFGETHKKQNARWLCKCSCGKKIVVQSNNLRNGATKSCGCLRVQRAIENITNYNSELNAQERDKRLYRIWNHMKQRCQNPKTDVFSYYGGRGIGICAEWNDFYAFQAWAVESGYREDLTIERIDVNGDYCPENCRWATMKEQAYNRRNNHRLYYDGKYLTITEWAKLLGCSEVCLIYRLNRGWPVEKVITMPIRRKQK